MAGRRHPSRNGSSRAAAVLSVLGGLALLALALPRLQSEWTLLVAGGLTADDGVAETLTRAGERSGLATAHHAAGVARLTAIATESDPAHRVSQAAAAAADFRQALALAPVDSTGWLRLAYAERLQNHWLEAARAWRLAALSGLFDPAAMARRVESGFALWPYMDLETRDALTQQLLTLHAWGPGTLAELTARFGAWAIVRHALSAHPGMRDDLERRMAAYVRNIGPHDAR